MCEETEQRTWETQPRSSRCWGAGLGPDPASAEAPHPPLHRPSHLSVFWGLVVPELVVSRGCGWREDCVCEVKRTKHGGPGNFVFSAENANTQWVSWYWVWRLPLCPLSGCGFPEQPWPEVKSHRGSEHDVSPRETGTLGTLPQLPTWVLEGV